MPPLLPEASTSLLSSLGVDDGSSASSRLAALKSDLDKARKERARLEKADEERQQRRRAIEDAEAQVESAKAEAAALTKRIEAEQRRRAELAETEQKRGRWVDPAKSESVDAEAQSKAAAALRRRKAGMMKLLATLREPGAAVREEDALQQLERELRALEKAHHGAVRELASCSKQVDTQRAQVAALRGGSALEGVGGVGGAGGDAEEREQQGEEYVRKLEKMRQSVVDSRTRAEAAKAEVQGAWEGWFEVLAGCARTLQAQADAGVADAPPLPDGEQTTPAFKVLELVRELSARHAELRKRVSASDRQAAEVQQKLDACQKRVAAQHVAIRHTQSINGRLAAARQRAAADVVSSRSAAPVSAPARATAAGVESEPTTLPPLS